MRHRASLRRRKSDLRSTSTVAMPVDALIRTAYVITAVLLNRAAAFIWIRKVAAAYATATDFNVAELVNGW
jgi:hypothetical protein